MENLDKVYAERIAEEYAQKKATKVVQLKKLDQKVKLPVKIIAYVVGVVGTLIYGVGFSMILSDFGPTGTLAWILGIVLGIIGLVACAINYPVYSKLLKSRKEKYAFEITTLAKEISEEA